jgi:hypothetical protein
VLVLPQEDSAELLHKLRTTRFGLAPIIFNKGFENIDKQLLTYLVKDGFARIKTATLQSQYFSGSQHRFLFYEDKVKRFPGVTQIADGSFVVKIGSRVLKSITYANQYEAAPLGIRVKFYALTFAYTLQGALLGLPPINDTFEGKAKAYLDPDDGKWKLDQLNLGDRGSAEYLTSVHKQYTAYIPSTPPLQAKTVNWGCDARPPDICYVSIYPHTGGIRNFMMRAGQRDQISGVMPEKDTYCVTVNQGVPNPNNCPKRIVKPDYNN